MKSRPGAKDLPPAPGDLRLVQAFFNTVDFEAERDELATPRALGEWLARHGLLAPGTEVEPADHARFLALREAWRVLLGGSEKPKMVDAFDRAVSTAALRGRTEAGGAIRVEPAAAGFDGAVGRLLAIAAEAGRDGTWRQLKVCASPTCRAVFYDFSTNHSGKWCRPRCGNRRLSRVSKRRRRRHWAERKAAHKPSVKQSEDFVLDWTKLDERTKKLVAKFGLEPEDLFPPVRSPKS